MKTSSETCGTRFWATIHFTFCSLVGDVIIPRFHGFTSLHLAEQVIEEPALVKSDQCTFYILYLQLQVV